MNRNLQTSSSMLKVPRIGHITIRHSVHCALIDQFIAVDSRPPARCLYRLVAFTATTPPLVTGYTPQL